ncbi:MAG: hypothetical protein PHU65_08155 [Actinomycetota bacterium]|nr:hypothetical protein [Actinomycetota bacterium]
MLKKILIGVAVFLTLSLSAAGIVYATNKSLGRNLESQNYSSGINQGSGDYLEKAGRNFRNFAEEDSLGGKNQYRIQEQECDDCENCLENQECNCEQNRLQKRNLTGNNDGNSECNCEENCIQNRNQENNPECIGEENCLRNQNTVNRNNNGSEQQENSFGRGNNAFGRKS